MSDEHNDQPGNAESPAAVSPAGSAGSTESPEPTESTEHAESTASAASSAPASDGAPDAPDSTDGSAAPPPQRVLTMLWALRALRVGWLLGVGAMAVLFFAWSGGISSLGDWISVMGPVLGGIALVIWLASSYDWNATSRFPLKRYPTSLRALIRKKTFLQPLCFLVVSGGGALIILRLWYTQFRSTTVSIDQLLTLAVWPLGLGLLAATDLLIRAARATYFPPPRKRRLRERLGRLKRMRLPRLSWRSALGAAVLVLIPPLILGTAVAVPHLVASRVTPSTAPDLDTSALPALPRSFAPTAAWSQDVHGMVDVVAGAAGPVILSSDGVVGLNPADGSTRWTYPRKRARFLQSYPSPDRRHLAVTLKSTDEDAPKGMSVDHLVVVLDTVTGRVTYEGFAQEGVLQLTDSVLLNGSTGYSLTDGSRLWSIDQEDISYVDDEQPYSGTAGHASFMLRGTPRRTNGEASSDGVYGTYTLMSDTDPSVRRRSAPLVMDGRGHPLVVDGWVAAFTETPKPIDSDTSPTGWAAQAVNLDAMAGVDGADTTTYDLGLTSGGNATASYATGTLTTLPRRTVGNGASSLLSSPKELEGGTAIAAVFDPQTRAVSHSAQEAGVLSSARLDRAESGGGGLLSVSSGKATPTTAAVPAGSTYYPPGLLGFWRSDELPLPSNPPLSTLSTPGTTVIILRTGPDHHSNSFRIYGIPGASS